MTDEEHIDAILNEWLGELDEHGCAADEVVSRWWRKDPAFDAYLADRFGERLERAVAGELDAWRGTPRGAVALVVLLDQMSRNIHRGSARMYDGDERALAIARELVSSGRHRELPAHMRVLVYMPFMHAEEVEAQEQCVELFARLCDDVPSLRENLRFAERHRDIVVRFGRFPHRNELLGRPSTALEVAFLREPGSSF